MKRKNKRGGYRPGAGRPVTPGWIKGDERASLSVPLRLKEAIKQFIVTNQFEVPMYEQKVRAGHPIFVNDEIPEKKSLLYCLSDYPEDVFLVKAEGDSMTKVNIFEGDTLVVDKSLEPRSGAIVVASVDGECLVKRLGKQNGKVALFPESEKHYPVVTIEEDTAFHILGVVRKKIGDVG
jgi:DNA polymerase V